MPNDNSQNNQQNNTDNKGTLGVPTSNDFNSQMGKQPNNSNNNDQNNDKNGNIQDGTKDLLKEGAKVAANKFAPGVGGKAVDALSKIPAVQRGMNKVTNELDKINKGADALKKIPGMSGMMNKTPAGQALNAINALNKNKPAAKDAADNKEQSQDGVDSQGDNGDSSEGQGGGGNFLNQFNPFGRSKNKMNDSKEGDSSFKAAASLFGRLPLPAKIGVSSVASVIFVFMFISMSITGQAENEYETTLIANQETGGPRAEEEYDTDDPEIKSYIERIKKVKGEYTAANKPFDVSTITAIYSIINAYNDSFTYDDMTESFLRQLADAYLNEEGRLADEDTIKSQLYAVIKDKIGNNFTMDDMEVILDEIGEYVEDYEDLIDYNQNNGICLNGIGVGNLQATDLLNLTHEEYLRVMGPLAQADYSRNGIFASVTLAQSILESGWGKTGLSLQNNNMFGQKCGDWPLDRCSVWRTPEDMGNGTLYYINDWFKKFNSIEESVDDHSHLFLTRSRYAAVLTALTPEAQITAIRQAGYATDIYYVSKVMNIINTYNLTQWDVTTNVSSNICYTGANAWTIRTTKPTASDVAYLENSKWRGHCTWYAKARAYEVAMQLQQSGSLTADQLSNIKTKLYSVTGNADVWVENSAGIFKTSTDINDLKAGSIISWKRIDDPTIAGHVAFVEEVTTDSVTITEGWATHGADGSVGASCPNDFGCVNFEIRTMSLSEYYNNYGKYNSGVFEFSGYIYPFEPVS